MQHPSFALASTSEGRSSPRVWGGALAACLAGICLLGSAREGLAKALPPLPPPQEKEEDGLRPIPPPTPIPLKVKVAKQEVVHGPGGSQSVTTILCEGDGSGCPIALSRW